MRERRSRPVRDWLVLLFLINLLPLAALAFVAWKVARGDVTWDEVLPEGLRRNGPYVCLWIGLLAVCAWLLVPLAQGGGRRARETLARSAAARAHGGLLRRAWEWLLWPFRQGVAGLLYVVRGVVLIVTFGVIALLVVYLVRLVSPDFLSDVLPFPEDPLARLTGAPPR